MISKNISRTKRIDMAVRLAVAAGSRFRRRRSSTISARGEQIHERGYVMRSKDLRAGTAFRITVVTTAECNSLLRFAALSFGRQDGLCEITGSLNRYPGRRYEQQTPAIEHGDDRAWVHRPRAFQCVSSGQPFF